MNFLEDQVNQYIESIPTTLEEFSKNTYDWEVKMFGSSDIFFGSIDFRDTNLDNLPGMLPTVKPPSYVSVIGGNPLATILKNKAKTRKTKRKV